MRKLRLPTDRLHVGRVVMSKLEVTMKSKGWCLLLSIYCLSAEAHAHHNAAAVYDVENLISVEGTVTEVHMVNPHAVIIVESADNSDEWEIEVVGPALLRRWGWTRDTVPVGAKVLVVGNPARSGANVMFLERFVFEDGREVVAQEDRP